MNRKLLVGIMASATLALVCAFVFAALTVYGVIDMGLARVLLLCAWLVGVAGTALSDLVWEKGGKHRIIFPLLVGVVLGAIFWQLDAFVIYKKSEQTKAEHSESPILTAISPTVTPTPILRKYIQTSRHPKPTPVPTPVPTPTPITIFVKPYTGVPTPVPPPEETLKPCYGDKLKECGDRELLEWGKPLMEKIDRISDQYSLDIKIIGDLKASQILKAMQAANRDAADKYRDCCAEDAINYYTVITSRLGGGNKLQSFSEWTQNLLSPVRSSAWKEARDNGGAMVWSIDYELGTASRHLQLNIDLRTLSHH
jgi:hypothetical protein